MAAGYPLLGHKIAYTSYIVTQRLFIRNVRARDQLEVFLVSAVSSLLLLRFYLYLTGYPQVGGGNLHIAHMLYGGLLMLVAIVLCLTFLGARVQRLAALVGGVGFGIFIDEIGKFLTKDNNYFFRPAIGIIYAVFVVLYLVFNFLGQRQRLTSREYQLNALTQLEEAVLSDMDPTEKIRVAELLQRAAPDSPITRQLQKFLSSIDTVRPDTPNRVQRLARAIDTGYRHLWKRRSSNVAVQLFFLLEIALFLGGVGVALFNNIDNVQDFFSGHVSYGRSLVIGQLAATVVAAGFAVFGAIRLASSRIDGFELFRRATLVNLLLTEFFIFSRIQFGAMPSFIFNLALLILINFVLNQERRPVPKQI